MRTLIVTLLVVQLGGCAITTTWPISTGAGVNPESAYVYGAFGLNINREANIALRLKGIGASNGNDYYLPLWDLRYGRRNRTDAYIVEIRPGSYEFGEVAFMTDLTAGVTRENRTSLFRTQPTFIVEIRPNTAYYLGDFTGDALVEDVRMTGSVTSPGGATIHRRYRWKLKSIEDNFSSTTLLVGQKFPNFQDIHKEDLMQFVARQTYRTRTDSLELDRYLSSKAYDKAYVLARKMAAGNAIYGEYVLGQLYENGLSVAESQLEAAFWYRKAAEGGYAEAMTSLARVLRNHGDEIRESLKERFREEDIAFLGVRTLRYEEFFWNGGAALCGSLQAMAANCTYPLNDVVLDEVGGEGARMRGVVYRVMFCEVALERTTDRDQRAVLEKARSEGMTLLGEGGSARVGRERNFFKSQTQRLKEEGRVGHRKSCIDPRVE